MLTLLRSESMPPDLLVSRYFLINNALPLFLAQTENLAVLG